MEYSTNGPCEITRSGARSGADESALVATRDCDLNVSHHDLLFRNFRKSVRVKDGNGYYEHPLGPFCVTICPGDQTATSSSSKCAIPQLTFF